MNENQIKDCDTWAERATNQKAEIARIPKHLVSAPANQLSLLSLMLNTCRSGFVMATRENKMFISHSLSWMSDERSTFRFTEYLVILELVIFFSLSLVGGTNVKIYFFLPRRKNIISHIHRFFSVRI